MRTSPHLLLCAALLCMALFFMLQTAAASPVYTRQTGADCATCHFQDMRSLNEYGRKFLMNSYRESARMIEERREREKKARAKRDERPRQPLEKLTGHPEDSGRIEEGEDHEALESSEEEALEELEKSAASD